MSRLGPRLVIAGTHSGVGKTTVATGLMAALSAAGTSVASAKIGPDFIDPGYHGLATGRPGRNLDPWICGPEAMAPLAARAGAPAWAGEGGVLVVEGVMGLFDGSASGGPDSSTAHVARLLDAPVVLVVDAAAMSGSVAALVSGFVNFDRGVRVAGVILNRMGSDNHRSILVTALEPLGIPVLGAIHRDDALVWRDRHLGLVPVVERPQALRAGLGRLAEVMRRSCDLDAIVALARSAPATEATDLWVRDEPCGSITEGSITEGSITEGSITEGSSTGPVRIAVAGGKAFSFSYPDNLERLEEAGAEIVGFDPLVDPALPEATDAVYAGGGFPEVYGQELAANRPLLDEVARRVAGGLPIWAECGGMLWLGQSLDGHAMAGVLPTEAHMGPRLSLGYRLATVRSTNPIAPAGSELRGHVFHYSRTDPPGDALDLSGGLGHGREGFAWPSLLAGYLHLHLGADPTPAQRFVKTAQRFAQTASTGAQLPSTRAQLPSTAPP